MPSPSDTIVEGCESDCGVSGFNPWDQKQWQLGDGYYHNHEGSVYQLHANVNSWALICVMLGILATKIKKWKGVKVWWWIWLHVFFELCSLMFATAGFVIAAFFHPNDRPLAHLYLKNPHSVLGMVLLPLWWMNPLFGYLGFTWTTKGPFYFKADDSRVKLGTVCKKIHNLSGRLIFVAGLFQAGIGLAHNLYPEGATFNSLAPYIFYLVILVGLALGAYPALRWQRTYYKKLSQHEVKNAVMPFEEATKPEEEAGAVSEATGGVAATIDFGEEERKAIQVPQSEWVVRVPKIAITSTLAAALFGFLAVVFALLVSLGAATEWMSETISLGVHLDVATEPTTLVAGHSASITLTSLSDSSGELVTWGSLVEEHGRRMHVVFVGSDFTVLGHVHPDDTQDLDDSTTTFTVSFTFPKAGRYICGVDALARYDQPKAFWYTSLRPIKKHFYLEVLPSDSSPSMASEPPSHSSSKYFAGIPEVAEDTVPDAFDISGMAGAYQLELTGVPAKVVGRNLQLEDGAGKIFANQESVLSFSLVHNTTGTVLQNMMPYLQVPLHIVCVHESLYHYMHTHGWKYSDEDEIGSVGAILSRHIHPTVAYDARFDARFYAHVTLPWEGRWHILCQVKHEVVNGANEIISFTFPVDAL
ncbi:hypothetical protein CYMTET_4439 [Cymbomonas tetramitiformis]|uniref:Uncharacterized protein n=1 Tax=Cymbomonas tetramitiformis TaxID=36881 RepID=A0AAE0H1D5_9CHLO|nr:hypothetical protein CYMTET_4439 [Cymbomonas tetramitiformis]